MVVLTVVILVVDNHINDSFPTKMIFSCCKTCQAGTIREYIKNNTYQYVISIGHFNAKNNKSSLFSSYLSSDNGIDDVHSSFSSHPENNEIAKSITSSPRPVSESSKSLESVTGTIIKILAPPPSDIPPPPPIAPPPQAAPPAVKQGVTAAAILAAKQNMDSQRQNVSSKLITQNDRYFLE